MAGIIPHHSDGRLAAGFWAAHRHFIFIFIHPTRLLSQTQVLIDTCVFFMRADGIVVVRSAKVAITLRRDEARPDEARPDDARCRVLQIGVIDSQVGNSRLRFDTVSFLIRRFPLDRLLVGHRHGGA